MQSNENRSNIQSHAGGSCGGVTGHMCTKKESLHNNQLLAFCFVATKLNEFLIHSCLQLLLV